MFFSVVEKVYGNAQCKTFSHNCLSLYIWSWERFLFLWQMVLTFTNNAHEIIDVITVFVLINIYKCYAIQEPSENNSWRETGSFMHIINPMPTTMYTVYEQFTKKQQNQFLISFSVSFQPFSSVLLMDGTGKETSVQTLPVRFHSEKIEQTKHGDISLQCTHQHKKTLQQCIPSTFLFTLLPNITCPVWLLFLVPLITQYSNLSLLIIYGHINIKHGK